MKDSHGERKHSKFSASGADRWFACPGSVSLSEGISRKDSVWSREGTYAHELLEELLRVSHQAGVTRVGHVSWAKQVPREMGVHVVQTANFILDLHRKHPHSELVIENRVSLHFVHPDAFGTLDGAVLDHFGTLHVLDFKYGVTPVSAKNNLQMIFYAMALAHQHRWNFSRVRLWILQPRVSTGEPTFWEISVLELKAYVDIFKKAVERVLENPKQYIEGDHCHWCSAKGVCPLKMKEKAEKAKRLFGPIK